MPCSFLNLSLYEAFTSIWSLLLASLITFHSKWNINNILQIVKYLIMFLSPTTLYCLYNFFHELLPGECTYLVLPTYLYRQYGVAMPPIGPKIHPKSRSLSQNQTKPRWSRGQEHDTQIFCGTGYFTIRKILSMLQCCKVAIYVAISCHKIPKVALSCKMLPKVVGWLGVWVCGVCYFDNTT